jgi:NAD-dependent SIR2 family protein deacetylase
MFCCNYLFLTIIRRLIQIKSNQKPLNCINLSLNLSLGALGRKSAYYRVYNIICLEEERLWLCSDCNPEVGGALKEELNSGAEDERNFKGLVKPDIVFFGEALPKIFHSSFETIRHADLVIVMGTSLKVFPFAFLVSCISDDVPVVLINRENPGIERNHLLFLPGDIQENIVKIAKDLNWNIVPN